MDVSTTIIGLPPGVVMAYAASTAPAGYMICDGSAVSRTTYASLFAVIGTAHGSGDGSTTFNIPDYRGRFLRALDGTAGRDPDKATRTAMNTGGNTGNNIGSVQSDEFESHTHIQNPHTHTITSVSEPAFNGATNSTASDGISLNVTSNSTTATNQNTGGNETRPLNAYVNYIIKT